MITYKGNFYDVERVGDDLILQGLAQDVTFFGAYRELKNQAIAELGIYRNDTTDDNDGQTLDYDSDEVNQYIENSIQEYVMSHEGEILTHNLN